MRHEYPAIESGVTPAEADALELLATGQRVLELGSWFGFSSVVMGRVAKKLTAVDWHHGDIHAGERDTEDIYRDNLLRYGVKRVDVRVGRFEDVLPNLSGPFDFVFLDGTHDEASVRRDLDLVERLLGSTFAIHDYLVDYRDDFEVKPVVDEWLADRPWWFRDYIVDSMLVLTL